MAREYTTRDQRKMLLHRWASILSQGRFQDQQVAAHSCTCVPALTNTHTHTHTHMPQATRHTLNVPSPMPLSGDGVRFRVRWRAEFKPPMMGKMQLPGT